MISIVSDLDHLVENTLDFVVQNLEDYVVAYIEILNAIDQNLDKKICVQVPVVVHWFKRMSERYPQGTMKFDVIDARSYLEQLWGLDIPAEVSSNEVVQAGLLNISEKPDPGEDFNDFILRTFYDREFAVKDFPFNNSVDLLEAYNEEKWKRNQQSPLIYRTYLDRIDQWKKNENVSQRRGLVERLSQDPQPLHKNLKRFKVLKFYKSLGPKLMGGEYQFFWELNLNLHQLEVHDNEIPEVVNHVKFQLKELDLPQNENDSLMIISSLSGYLLAEFDFIETDLLQKPELISDKIVGLLSEKFSSLMELIKQRVEKLKELIKPEVPSLPDLSWDFDRMLVWATEKYLPYQSWCDKNNVVDLRIYELSELFSNWVAENWHEIHSNSKHMVFNIFPNHAKDFQQDDKINLVLVIDNLGWNMASDLEQLFLEQNFNILVREPYLSMLPSETEISKKCLLSGAPTYAGIDNNTYTNIIEKGWVPYFNDASFRYLSDPGKLNAITEIDAKTYVVNYHAVDAALHTPSDKLGLSHIQHIHNILVGFVDKVIGFIKRHNIQNQVRIHIVTDHGSIRIPDEAPNDLDPNFFKSSKFPEVSHRYVSITNIGFTQLPDYLRKDCVLLPSNEFGNEKHFLCAKRANRFKPTDNSSYVHGGVSPEEVIVPYLTFESVTQPVQELSIILVNNKFRYREEEINIEVGNPNQSKVENVQISVLNNNIEAEPLKLDNLGISELRRASINALFKKTNITEDQTNISFLVSFYCRGERHSFTIIKPIEMKTMFEVKDTSMFDDLD